MASKWYERYPLRIAAEKLIMEKYHPQFVLKMDNQKRLFWEGILETNFGSLFLLNILYPPGYPGDMPKSNIIDPPVRPGAPHRFLDGSLCVYPNDWGPKRCTAPEAVPLIAAWLALYEVFLRTGERW